MIGCPPRRPAPRSDLYRLTRDAREKLHAWFRENEGTLPLKEIQRRLADEFAVKAGLSTLSRYWRLKEEEIFGHRRAAAILIRVETGASPDWLPKISIVQPNESMEVAR